MTLALGNAFKWCGARSQATYQDCRFMDMMSIQVQKQRSVVFDGIAHVHDGLPGHPSHQQRACLFLQRLSNIDQSSNKWLMLLAAIEGSGALHAQG